jgi:transcriptional regulator with XRE-family HTH domain
MGARGLTYRGLAEATRELDGRGITHAHINMLANGHDRPSMRAMELIAQACGVAPEYFAEYRLAAAMRELDPTEVGLERALQNLNARLGERRRAGARAPVARRPRARPRPSES